MATNRHVDIGIVGLGWMGGNLALQARSVPDYVEDTGEVNWLVADALEMEVPIPIIAQSVIELFRSREAVSVSTQAIAMMRHGFSGHPFDPTTRLELSVAAEELTHRGVAGYEDWTQSVGYSRGVYTGLEQWATARNGES